MENTQFQAIENFDTVDIKHLFNLLRRNLGLLLLGFFVAAIVAFAFSKVQTPIYEAKTQVMVTRSSSTSPVADVTQALNSNQLSQTYVELLSQEWVRDAVAERLAYEINKSVVNISAATNTQIITVTIEDPAPEQAKIIADTFVQVLLEQNENIQSGRYGDAEQSLYQQIAEMETQITEAQAELDDALNQAFGEQVTAAQRNIQTVQGNIATAEDSLNRLQAYRNSDAVSLALLESQQQLYEAQSRLNQWVVDYNAVENRLQSETAADTIAQLESQKAELSVSIETANTTIAEIEADITWLTPLVDPAAFTQEVAALQEELDTQRSLLASYKKTYTDLLASGKIENSTNEIDRLQKNIDLYQQIYLDLLNNRETIQLERMQNMPNIVQLNPAVASEQPVRPRTLLNTLLGAIAGLILAVAFVLLRDFLDTSVKSSEEIERSLGISVIGRILHLNPEENQAPGPFVVNQPRSPATEAFRSLRTNLDFMGIDEPLKSILISSPGMSEGKTTVAANLAAIIAQGGKRVAIIDADFRRPRLHEEMDIPNRVGLSDVFRDRISLQDVTQKWRDSNLFVVPAGEKPPNPAELLGSEKMKQLLSALEEEYDLVIIDSTPTVVTDSQLVSARVNGVLLVLSIGKTDLAAAQSAVEQYQRAGARLLGGVMNNIHTGAQGYGYASYEYTYGESEQATSRIPAFFANLLKRLGVEAEKQVDLPLLKKAKPLGSLWLWGLGAILLGALLWTGFALSAPAAASFPVTSPTSTLVAPQEATATPQPIQAPSATPEQPVEPIPAQEVSLPTAMPTLAHQYLAGEVLVRQNDNMEIAYVPAGEFTMGNDNGEQNEKPAHTVYLETYWIDLNEVTNRQYVMCMQAGFCNEPPEGYYNYPSLAEYPIVHVSWEDANDYCTWAGGNLPTEAEWEKAARSTDQRLYPWGNEGFNCNVLNYENCLGNMSTVRGYELGRSPYGAYDMAGNVWEWVTDWYGENYYVDSPLTNPSGPAEGNVRVIRGGAWDDVNYHVRTTYRSWRDPLEPGSKVGFRCVTHGQP